MLMLHVIIITLVIDNGDDMATTPIMDNGDDITTFRKAHFQI